MMKADTSTLNDDSDFEKQLDDVFEDLIIGHNFNYARKAILDLVHQRDEAMLSKFIDWYNTNYDSGYSTGISQARVNEFLNTGPEKGKSNG